MASSSSPSNSKKKNDIKVNIESDDTSSNNIPFEITPDDIAQAKEKVNPLAPMKEPKIKEQDPDD